MASLTGQPINTTYPGLLKTNDNSTLPTGGTVATVTDGEGNPTGLRLGQNFIAIEPEAGYIYDVGAENGFQYDATSVRPQGQWDFAGSTVTGLPGGGGTSGTSGTSGTAGTSGVDGSGTSGTSGTSGGGGGSTAVSTTTQTIHSGPDGADVNFVSFLIPGGTFIGENIINIKVLTTQDYTGGGWVYSGAWLSSSTAVFSGFNIGSHASTTDMSFFYDKTGYIHTTNGSGLGTAFHGADLTATDQDNNGYSQYSDNMQKAINWNNDVYLNVSCFVDNAGSSITVQGINVSKIN